MNNLDEKLKAFLVQCDEVKTNGIIYKGELNHLGQKHGFGRIQWPEGSVYVGQWMNDMLSGRGSLVFEGKLQVDGNFKSNRADGTCYVFDADGNCKEVTYPGSDGQGFGVEYSKDGGVYIGYFKHGKKEGRGTFQIPRKGVYKVSLLVTGGGVHQ